MKTDTTIKKRWPTWLIILVSSGLYFAAALVSILGTANSLFAPFWYANAFGLLCLLLVQKNSVIWAMIFLGIANFSANLVSGYGVISSAVFVPGNLAEIWLASTLVSRYRDITDAFISTSEFLKLIAYCILIPSVFGAIVGSSLLSIYEIAPFLNSFVTWLVGDVMGYILVFPFCYSLLFDAHDKSEDTAKLSLSKLKHWGIYFIALAGSLGVAYYCLSRTSIPFLAIATISAFAAQLLDFRRSTFLYLLMSVLFGILINRGDFYLYNLEHTQNFGHYRLALLFALFIPLYFAVSLNGLKHATQKLYQQQSMAVEAEEALRLKESYQRALLDNFPFAVWLKDTGSRFLSVNAEFARVFGFTTSEELTGKSDFDIAPVELAEKYRSDDQQVLHSRQNKNVEEIIFSDGERKWFETYKAPVIDVNQQLLGTVGFARDITARKKAEESLHLAASVFTFAREGIMITNPDGKVLNVNQAFTRITGYSQQEILGQNPRILSSGKQSPEFYQVLWKSLIKNGYWQGEIWNRRKSGEVYAELLTISAVRDLQGVTINYVALFSDITPQKEHEHQLEHIAHYDALTQLPNRVLLADRLNLAMIQATRRQQPLAVVYIDLDGFKDINDSHGHAVGDELLMITASRMKQRLRDGDTLARMGGDEFVAVLVEIGDSVACIPLLNRLLESASELIVIDGTELRVSASLGISFYPQDTEIEADQLLRQADQAMYQAKLSGKNRYHIFDARQDSSIRIYHENLQHIQQALVRREFVLHYQPKVNLRTGEIVGVEALIRWNHPQRGLLTPALFLPAIEEHQLAIELGEWVIDSSLLQIEQWQSMGLDIPVSVNICAKHLQQDNFVERLSSLLTGHPRVNASKLVLEILETSALEDVLYVSKVIESCASFGVSFALDDFGTGYSSLTYLKRLPVSQIKIDQSFVRDMLDDPEDQAILIGVIGLANAFNRTVIAEGVESRLHGQALLKLGCQLAQGYGIARPMPADEIPEWTTTWQSDTSNRTF